MICYFFYKIIEVTFYSKFTSTIIWDTKFDKIYINDKQESLIVWKVVYRIILSILKINTLMLNVLTILIVDVIILLRFNNFIDFFYNL